MVRVLIQTHNALKYEEFKKYFSDIGMETHWLVERAGETYNPRAGQPILGEEAWVISEQTALKTPDGLDCDMSQVQACVHHSTLWSTFYHADGSVHEKKYHAQVEGFLFPALKRHQGGEAVYGWDDRFVAKQTHLSNQALKALGLKNSARDLAFAALTQDPEWMQFFQLKAPMNLNFNPVEQEGVISFEPVIQQWCHTHELFQLAYGNDFFNPLLNHVFNQGLFTRQARTRQQKNYWLPGVNAGLPLTPKKDEVHEMTFMFHDLMHFVFPDLILTASDEKNRRVYIMARMMSEAFTIVLADALFVNVLKTNGIAYDFDKRKIHPLFEKSLPVIKPDAFEKITALLHANARFALLGDESELRALNAETPEAFEAYKNKYQPFFDKDYQWTDRNHAFLNQQTSVNQAWFKACLEHGLLASESTESASEGLVSLAPESVFEHVFKRFKGHLKQALNAVEEPELQGRKKAMSQFWAGQLMIFFKQPAHYNELFKKTLFEQVKGFQTAQHETELNGRLAEVEQTYALYLKTLQEDKLISTYKQKQYERLYPLFDPFFVFYEQKNSTFETTFKRIFKDLS